MSSQNDEINLALTNEEVDDALNFGINFDDMQDQDNSLPTLNALGFGNTSVGTRSPSPPFDDQSLTSTGSKRSRAEFCGDAEEEGSPKRRMSSNMAWNRGGGGGGAGTNDTALAAIRLDREREGRCPDCGLETHSIVRGEKGYEKTPLNVEGEVLDGRCLFCHPLEEGESPKNKDMSAASNNAMPVIGQKNSFQFNGEMITPHQQRMTPMQSSNAPTPNPTPNQSRKSAGARLGSKDSNARKHTWKEHVRNLKDDKGIDDDASRGSQYSNRSQVSDGMGRLGNAMASGMGMRSPKTNRDPPSTTTTPISQSSNSGTNMLNGSQTTSPLPLGGNDRGNTTERDVPAHVRLAHNKLPSSIYHHHLFPMSQETEQAYIEKTLAYLESGGGDIVDVIVAMRRFPFSLPIQSLCCEKLYVHCFDNDHAHAIVLVGGIRTVIDAMEHHSKDVALQRGCAGIIKHMATASKYNLEMLDRMGAVRVVVNAMEQNMNSAPLLESCCWALGTMARGPNSEIKMRIAKAGGVHMAMNAVEQFPKNESLLRAAFHCLQQLGYNPSSYAAGYNQMQQSQSPQQQHQQQMQNPQMSQKMQQLQQLENAINLGGGGGNHQMNQNQQQQLQRMMQNNEMQQMMQNNEMQQMKMNQVQQQQLQRMMSQNNEMKQMQMQNNQQQLLNRQMQQQQQQQMLAMSQAGISNEEIMMRMQMRNSMGGNMGNAMSGNSHSNSSTPGGSSGNGQHHIM